MLSYWVISFVFPQKVLFKEQMWIVVDIGFDSQILLIYVPKLQAEVVYCIAYPQVLLLLYYCWSLKLYFILISSHQQLGTGLNCVLLVCLSGMREFVFERQLLF